jgi:hypothetical protein
MSGSEVPRLFACLVDDAGLFPPQELPMPAAIRRHRENQERAHRVLTHRFLCPADGLSRLLTQLDPADRFHVGVIVRLEPSAVRAAVAIMAADSRVVLAGVEGLPPAGNEPADAARRGVAALDSVPRGVPGYIEVPLVGEWQAGLAVVAESGRAAKIRCGGPRADHFPSPDELARFVWTCARRRVPFKATAGLHHAVRYRDGGTGFEHHGFLNLLLAACRAADGAALPEVAAVLRLSDVARLVDEARSVRPGVADAARSLFVAYGSCSTSEPLADLELLGLAPSAGTEVAT